MRLDAGGGRWRGLSEQLDPVPYRPLPALRELQLAADIGGGDEVWLIDSQRALLPLFQAR